MNIYYTKTALYAYANLEAVKGQIDDLVERKALCSMNDYSPCVEIAEKIVEYTRQKIALIELKDFMDKVIKKLKPDDMDCLDYKYFKKRPKDYYNGFDYFSRNYFRKQVRIAEKFSKALEKIGATDKWFEENCLTMDFFRELLRRVYEHEKNSMKNKPQGKKTKIVKTSQTSVASTNSKDRLSA